MIHKMTLREFAELAKAVTEERPEGISIGQWAFALLDKADNGIASEIALTNADPFFDDSMLKTCLVHILDRYVELPSEKSGGHRVPPIRSGAVKTMLQ